MRFSDGAVTGVAPRSQEMPDFVCCGKPLTARRVALRDGKTQLVFAASQQDAEAVVKGDDPEHRTILAGLDNGGDQTILGICGSE